MRTLPTVSNHEILMHCHRQGAYIKFDPVSPYIYVSVFAEFRTPYSGSPIRQFIQSNQAKHCSMKLLSKGAHALIE